MKNTGNLHVKGTKLLLTLGVKSVVVSGTSTFREHFSANIFFYFHKLHFYAHKVKFNSFFLTIHVFYIAYLTMENSLLYAIFCWIFATSAHQRMMFQVKTKFSLKFCESFTFSLRFPCRNFKQIRGLCYMQRRSLSLFPGLYCVWHFVKFFQRKTIQWLGQ